jgi:hypothetical protein
LGDALLQIKHAFSLINHGILRDINIFENIIEDVTKHTYNRMGMLSREKSLSNNTLVSEALLLSK